MELRELKEQAGEHWAKGQFAQAEELYRQILMLSPLDPQLWVRHAEALKRLGRTFDAVGSYRRASQMLAEVGLFPRAIAALRLALELTPDDVDLISELIRLELKKNKKGGPKTLEMPVTDLPPPAAASQPLALPMLQDPAAVEDAVTNPGLAVEVAPPEYPLVRHLSERALAIRLRPGDPWMVVTSESKLTVWQTDDLPDPDPTA